MSTENSNKMKKSLGELGQLLLDSIEGQVQFVRIGYNITIDDQPTKEQLQEIGRQALLWGDITEEGERT